MSNRTKADEDLLRYVAKVGFIRKSFWDKYFFKGGSRSWNYAAWRKLSERGLKPHPEVAYPDVYVLDRESLWASALGFDRAVRSPSPSHWLHDELMFGGIITLSRNDSLLNWFSELELRSQSVHHFDQRLDRQKFPDVKIYLKRPDKPLVVALEMERTLKSTLRYIHIFRQYAKYTDLDALCWIVPDRSFVSRLQKIMNEESYSRPNFPIRFIEERSWVFDPKKCIESALNFPLQH